MAWIILYMCGNYVNVWLASVWNNENIIQSIHKMLQRVTQAANPFTARVKLLNNIKRIYSTIKLKIIPFLLRFNRSSFILLCQSRNAKDFMLQCFKQHEGEKKQEYSNKNLFERFPIHGRRKIIRKNSAQKLLIY